MDAAVTDYAPAMGAVQLACQVMAADTLHARLCGAVPADEAAINTTLAGYYAGLEELAATPATTPAGLQAKARALATCFIGGSVEGDRGLAWSLVTDLLQSKGT